MALSDRILADNRAVFEAMTGHRFVADIKADRLPGKVFDRYLVFEGAFVDTAIAIFALALARAPGIAERRWLVAVLDGLANAQVGYFEAAFRARGIDPGAHDPSHPDVAAFRDGMLRIAEGGGYLDIIAAMFAAEWMYWTWCGEAASRPIADPLLQVWVEMHADATFAAQARWLRAQLDAAEVTEAEAARLSAIFGRAQELEIAFHEAAYG